MFVVGDVSAILLDDFSVIRLRLNLFERKRYYRGVQDKKFSHRSGISWDNLRSHLVHHIQTWLLQICEQIHESLRHAV